MRIYSKVLEELGNSTEKLILLRYTRLVRNHHFLSGRSPTTDCKKLQSVSAQHLHSTLTVHHLKGILNEIL